MRCQGNRHYDVSPHACASIFQVGPRLVNVYVRVPVRLTDWPFNFAERVPDVGMNLLLPTRKVTQSLKYFDEFSNQWTYQGYSLQISAAVVFLGSLPGRSRLR